MANKEYQGATKLEAIDVSANDHDFRERIPRAIWVGTSGDLNVVDQEGDTVLVPSASGEMNIQPQKILSSSTTASGIVAYY